MLSSRQCLWIGGIFAGILHGFMGAFLWVKQQTFQGSSVPLKIGVIWQENMQQVQTMPDSLSLQKSKSQKEELIYPSLASVQKIEKKPFVLPSEKKEASVRPSSVSLGTVKNTNEPKNPQPAYPLQARRLGIEGTVYAELFIDNEGKVQNIHILLPYAHPLLEAAALATLRTWSFAPNLTGKSIQIKVPIEFKLKKNLERARGIEPPS